MIKNWSFFDSSTGHFVGRTFSGLDQHLQANTPAGCAAAEGLHDHLSQRVDVERLQADRAAALERHREEVDAKRTSFKPKNALDVFPEPVFDFRPTAEHVIDWVPPQPDLDHEWNSQTRRWQKRADVAAREARSAQARAQIAALELQQARPMRELLVNPQNAEARARLQALDAQIADARGDLVLPPTAPLNSNDP
ncbi:MAG TPA: hypothetical protein VFA81_09465 [Burkholderiales bacterium]|nr:hypothetical protein [Burkholderiales bacterium]